VIVHKPWPIACSRPGPSSRPLARGKIATHFMPAQRGRGQKQAYGHDKERRRRDAPRDPQLVDASHVAPVPDLADRPSPPSRGVRLDPLARPSWTGHITPTTRTPISAGCMSSAPVDRRHGPLQPLADLQLLDWNPRSASNRRPVTSARVWEERLAGGSRMTTPSPRPARSGCGSRPRGSVPPWTLLVRRRHQAARARGTHGGGPGIGGKRACCSSATRGRILAGFRGENPQFDPRGEDARLPDGATTCPTRAHARAAAVAREATRRPVTPRGSRPSREGRRATATSKLARPISDTVNLAAISLRLGGRRLLWDSAGAKIRTSRRRPVPDEGLSPGMGTGNGRHPHGRVVEASVHEGRGGLLAAGPGSWSRIRRRSGRIRWACRSAARSIPCARCSRTSPRSPGRWPIWA